MKLILKVLFLNNTIYCFIVTCNVVDDRENSLSSVQTNEPVLRIPITDDQSSSLIQYAKEKKKNCKDGKEFYRPLGQNCVDFVQGGFESAGFPGHFGELIEPKKLASKIKGANGKHGLAAQYTFARVMGLAAFFLAQFTAFEFSDDYATRKILYAADLIVAGLTLYLLYKCIQKTGSCCSRIAKAIPSKVEEFVDHLAFGYSF